MDRRDHCRRSAAGHVRVRRDAAKTSGGVCWGATYSAPFLIDDGTQFKDKAD
jgi:hypothetical protein